MKHEDYLKQELWVAKRKGEISILPVEQLTKKDKKLGRYRPDEILECIKSMRIWNFDIHRPIKKRQRFKIVDNGDYVNGYLHIRIGNGYHNCLSPRLLKNFNFIKQKKEFTKADILEAKISDWKKGFAEGRNEIQKTLIRELKRFIERIENLH